MKQNDEKFDEIGEEQVKPRAPGSTAEILQHANGPQNADLLQDDVGCLARGEEACSDTNCWN